MKIKSALFSLILIFFYSCYSIDSFLAIENVKSFTDELVDKNHTVEEVINSIAGIDGNVDWNTRTLERYKDNSNIMCVEIIITKPNIDNKIIVQYLVNTSTDKIQLESLNIGDKTYSGFNAYEMFGGLSATLQFVDLMKTLGISNENGKKEVKSNNIIANSSVSEQDNLDNSSEKNNSETNISEQDINIMYNATYHLPIDFLEDGRTEVMNKNFNVRFNKGWGTDTVKEGNYKGAVRKYWIYGIKNSPDFSKQNERNINTWETIQGNKQLVAYGDLNGKDRMGYAVIIVEKNEYGGHEIFLALLESLVDGIENTFLRGASAGKNIESLNIKDGTIITRVRYYNNTVKFEKYRIEENEINLAN